MTTLEKLKRYVYPYYQTSGDEATLESYISEYTTAESAAYELWGEMAQYIIVGNIKQLDTGAESTTFHSPKEIEDYCKSRALYYYKKSAKNTNQGSLAALVDREEIAGGVY